MKRRLIQLTAISALLIGAVVPSGPVDAAKGSDQIKELQDVNQKKASILEEIAEKNQDLKKYTDEIKKAEAEIQKLQKEVKKVEVELKKAQDKQAYYQGLYNRRMVTFYNSGEVGYLSHLLKAESLYDFFQSIEWIRLVAINDSVILEEHKQATANVQKKMDEINKLQEQQQEKASEVQKNFDMIMKEMKNKESELAKLDEIIEDYEEEIIDINRQLISSGRLKFSFTGSMTRPTNARFTSGYKERWGRFHHGYDYAGPVGTPYWAAADGVVVESRVASGYGWLITIYHGTYKGQNLYTRYAHSYKNQVLVRVGQEVKKGQQIASIGNNGRSTGPHLHFEVRYGQGSTPPSSNPGNWI